jgi:ribosome recycling factor
MQEIINHADEQMQKSLVYLENSLKKIRTGRGHPSILDGIVVDYYGTPTPLNQVCNILAEDSHTLSVTPWEKNLVPDIEKAILKSNLGFNPFTQGDVIKLPLPMMTEETRNQYVKQSRSEAEKAKVAVRNLRRSANDALKKDSTLSEDDRHKASNKIQDITDKFIAKIDAMLVKKEKELMTI